MSECTIDEIGTKKWYKNGKLHREDDLPAVEYTDGCKEWHVYGLRHREDGPAIEDLGGYKAWYVNGNRYSFNDYCIALYGSLAHPKSIMLQVKYG